MFRRDWRKLIVLFDEFDAITTNRAFDLEFYSFLRSVANNYDVAYVTSSARDLAGALPHPADRRLAVLQHLHQCLSSRLHAKEAIDLITKPSAEAGLPLEGYARRITEIGGLFPLLSADRLLGLLRSSVGE